MTPGAEASRRALICATALAAARADASLIDLAVRPYLGWPETNQVLDGSVQHLWRSILTPEQAEGLPPLSARQKSWLLFHAGALRGFNLALITAWRQTADTIETTDQLYPGFAGHCAIAHEVVSAHRGYVLTGSGDDRAVAERVTRGALDLLGIGIEQGYGLGLIVDSALSGAPAGSGIEPAAPAQAARAITERLRGTADDRSGPLLRALLAMRPADQHRLADETLASPEVRQRLLRHVETVSGSRPLAVPSTIGRFSWPYVTTMLAYFVRWWLAAGAILAWRQPDLPVGQPRSTAPGMPAGLHDLAIEWARQELPAVVAVLDQPAALRWRLSALAETMTALGWHAAGGRTGS